MESGSTVQLPLVLTIYEVELFWEVHESHNPWPAQGWISAFKLLSPNSVVPKESFLPKRLNMLVLLIRLITFSFSTSKRLAQQISMKTWRLFLNSTKGNVTSVSLLYNIIRLNVLHMRVFFVVVALRRLHPPLWFAKHFFPNETKTCVSQTAIEPSVVVPIKSPSS
jgi:hypothetical protein